MNVGDKVYYKLGFSVHFPNMELRSVTICDSKYLGEGEIVGLDSVVGRFVVKFEFGETEVWEDNLIPKEIYESPLFKAMKEDV